MESVHSPPSESLPSSLPLLRLFQSSSSPLSMYPDPSSSSMKSSSSRRPLTIARYSSSVTLSKILYERSSYKQQYPYTQHRLSLLASSTSLGQSTRLCCFDSTHLVVLGPVRLAQPGALQLFQLSEPLRAVCHCCSGAAMQCRRRRCVCRQEQQAATDLCRCKRRSKKTRKQAIPKSMIADCLYNA
jgi:hypothetical protein